MGSSANSTVGSATRARATATRCCWPPDISAGRCERRSSSPTRSITASTQERSILRPAIDSGSVTFSSAVSVGTRLNAWNTKPMCLRRSSVSCLSPIVVMSWPPISTVPSVGRSRPASRCIRVDLPEPLGPMIAVNWPVGHLERDAAHGLDRRVAVAVAADEVVGRDTRRDWAARSGRRLLVSLYIGFSLGWLCGEPARAGPRPRGRSARRPRRVRRRTAARPSRWPQAGR